jgi:hypothetical protein
MVALADAGRDNRHVLQGCVGRNGHKNRSKASFLAVVRAGAIATGTAQPLLRMFVTEAPPPLRGASPQAGKRSY